MKIIIPMAGLGSRFQKESDKNPEYKKPKPFIVVKGSPMVRWATGSLPFILHKGQKKTAKKTVPPENLIFIILQEHDDTHDIEKGLKEIYSPAITVIKLPAITRGAAETAYQAKKFVGDDEEIIITDSDHYFDGNELAKAIKNKHKDTVGIIPLFKAKETPIPKHSYSLMIDGSTVIKKVAEKDMELMKLGAHANIGAYYFSKAKYFFDEAFETISKNVVTGQPGKGEFYIAPLYQKLIEKGKKIQGAVIKATWTLGTPEELELFLSQNVDLNDN